MTDDPVKGLLPYPYDRPRHGSDSYVLEDLSKYISSILKTTTREHVEEAIGFQQISHIMLLATHFLAFECDNNGFQPVEQQETPEEFTGFAVYYTQIGQALDNIGTEIITETRPQTLLQRYSVEETIRYNISPERVSQIFRKVSSCPSPLDVF
jgi:hypothetical protein